MTKDRDSEASFKKSLNLFDCTALVMGSMIGSGIFIVSADMARTLGSPGWLLVAWAITGVLTLIAALTYGELAAMMPHAGGQYVYLREAYSPLAGFLYGWTLFLVIQTGTIAALGMAFGKFLGVFLPSISESKIWLQLGPIKLSTAHVVAVSVIAFLTVINTRGIITGKHVQNVFTSTKVAAMAVFLVLGLFVARNSAAVDANLAILWDGVKNSGGQLVPLTGFALAAMLGTSLVGSFFSSDAWNNVTFAAAEVTNPKRTIPLSLFLGVLVVSSMYVLVNLVYVVVLPLRGTPDADTVMGQGIQFAQFDRLGTAAMHGVFGDSAVAVMAGLILISVFGCTNGLILSGARVYWAMAEDGVFFRSAGRLNSKAVPGIALGLQGLWAALLCLSGTYSDLLDYVVFAVLIFYVLTIGGVFILRWKRPTIERPYRAFGYPVLPAIYIVCCVFIMSVLLIYKPAYTWPGLIVVLLGIPVYFAWRRQGRGVMEAGED